MSRSRTIYGPGLIQGTTAVPGDKSISHRVAILASLAAGVSTIEGYASGADCITTLECLRKLGVSVEQAGASIAIHGPGLYGYKPNIRPAVLDAGNSGSTIRMISGVLAAQPFTSIIDGDDSLKRRPMARVIKPLELMGARIEAGEGGRPPLVVHGGKLRPIAYTSPVASAQVKSCVLLAGLFAEGTTSVAEPSESRNHTELMLAEFGVRVRAEGRQISVEGPAELRPVTYRVPGDFSSAAFFAAAAAMLPGSTLVVRSVNLNPTRTAFLEVLEQLGAAIEPEEVRREHGELIGNLCIRGRGLRTPQNRTLIRGDIIPKIIDELPLLAAVATQTAGRVEVRDARELRIKESDRIAAIAAGIRALGGSIDEFEDGFSIAGPQSLTGSLVSSAGDHRIAMALSIAGLAARGTTEIADADAAAISFPTFYELLNSVLREGKVV